MKSKINVTNVDVNTAVRSEAPRFGVKIAFTAISFVLDIVSCCILSAMGDK